MKPAKYSIIVHAPSSDVPTEGHETLHLNLALKDLNSLYQLSFPQLFGPGSDEHASACSWQFPLHIVRFFMEAEQNGNFRVELLEGSIEYKLYIQPQD